MTLIEPGAPFYALDQMIAATLSQGGLDVYGPPWVATEGYIRDYGHELAVVRADIAELFATVPDPADRLAAFMFARVFGPARFDLWLHAVDRRIAQALVGDHSEPIVDPSGD